MLNWGGLADPDRVGLTLGRSVPGVRRAGLGTCTAGAGAGVVGTAGTMSGCVTGRAVRDEGENRHVSALRKLDAMEDDHERGEVATGEVVATGTRTGSGLDMEIGTTWGLTLARELPLVLGVILNSLPSCPLLSSIVL